MRAPYSMASTMLTTISMATHSTDSRSCHGDVENTTVSVITLSVPTTTADMMAYLASSSPGLYAAPTVTR